MLLLLGGRRLLLDFGGPLRGGGRSGGPVLLTSDVPLAPSLDRGLDGVDEVVDEEEVVEVDDCRKACLSSSIVCSIYRVRRI